MRCLLRRGRVRCCAGMKSWQPSSLGFLLSSGARKCAIRLVRSSTARSLGFLARPVGNWLNRPGLRPPIVSNPALVQSLFLCVDGNEIVQRNQRRYLSRKSKKAEFAPDPARAPPRRTSHRKNALSATCPVGADSGCAFHDAAERLGQVLGFLAHGCIERLISRHINGAMSRDELSTALRRRHGRT
jgi:hypothetical protein